MHEDDASEVALAEMAEITGLRQTGCPWWALRDPFVQSVVNGHRWWKERQLATRWPGPPAALVFGIEAFDSALNAVLAQDQRLDAEEREREHQEAQMQQSPRTWGAHGMPVHRRR